MFDGAAPWPRAWPPANMAPELLKISFEHHTFNRSESKIGLSLEMSVEILLGPWLQYFYLTMVKYKSLNMF